MIATCAWNCQYHSSINFNLNIFLLVTQVVIMLSSLRASCRLSRAAFLSVCSSSNHRGACWWWWWSSNWGCHKLSSRLFLSQLLSQTWDTTHWSSPPATETKKNWFQNICRVSQKEGAKSQDTLFRTPRIVMLLSCYLSIYDSIRNWSLCTNYWWNISDFLLQTLKEDDI